MNVLTAAKLARPLLFLEQTPEGTGVMLRSSSLPLGAGQEAISTKEALYGYTPHRTLAQSLSGWSGGGRGTAGRDGFCHGLDGPASVLRQLPHHAGGRRDAHAKLACNECHAPHNLLAKLPFKAQEGLRDFMGNVSGKDIPRPLSARTRDVVNENCKACHFATNSEVASMDAKPYCVDCHRNMAHMRHKPISTRTVAYD